MFSDKSFRLSSKLLLFLLLRPGSSTSLGSLGAGEAGPVSVSGSDSGVEIPMSPGSGDGEMKDVRDETYNILHNLREEPY